MVDLLRWRKRNGLTQVEAAALLGVSQPYLSLLEKRARPLTAALRHRMERHGGEEAKRISDHTVRAQLSALGYPGFAHIEKAKRKPRPDTLLMAVLAQPDADARVVEALPWLITEFKDQFDYGSMLRQGKLQNLQNRLGFLLQLAGVDTPGGLLAVHELDRARLLREDTLCWDSMPMATRDWVRRNRSPLAEHWNVLTRLHAKEAKDAA